MAIVTNNDDITFDKHLMIPRYWRAVKKLFRLDNSITKVVITKGACECHREEVSDNNA